MGAAKSHIFHHIFHTCVPHSFHTSDDRKVHRAGAGALDANMALETGNVERNLAKIFREKIKVFGAIQFTQVRAERVTVIPSHTL